MKKITTTLFITVFLLINKVLISQCTPANVPYYEAFSAITANNQLPACWAASNMSNTCLTYASPSLCAGFNAGISNTSYFYSKPINLYAGVTYSAAVWYKTDNTLGSNWSSFSILYGPGQSSVGLTTVANLSGTVSNASWTLLSNTFVVGTTGVYNIAIAATGSSVGTSPNLYFDDLMISTPCNFSNNLPPINISSSTPTLICTGTAVTLTASGANSYTWNTFGSNNAIVTYTPNGGQTQSVTGTNSITNCTAGANITFSVNLTPGVAILPTAPASCAGTSYSLYAIGAASNLWSNGATTNTITITPITNTVYSVIGTSTNGCTGSATYDVTVKNNPTVNIVSTPSIICAGESSTLQLTGGDTYSTGIVPGSSPLNVYNITPTSTTVYTITGFNNVGCSATVNYTLTVNKCTDIKPNSLNGTQIREFIMYPQPSDEFLTIEFTALNLIDFQSDMSNFDMQLINSLGEKCKLEFISIGHNKCVINTGIYNAGIYYLTIKSDREIIAKEKILIK